FGKIVTIQNGVDFSRFSPSLRQARRRELGSSAETLVICTAGRLVPVKDQANFVGALGLLRDRGVQFAGVISGAVPLRAELVAHVMRLCLTDAVRRIGQRRDIERIYAALDVFVLPSKSEGKSNTILEAMASATPIVATNVGAAAELIEDGRTGLLVP